MKLYPLLLITFAPTLQAETPLERQSRLRNEQRLETSRNATEQLLRAALEGTVAEIKTAFKRKANKSAEDENGMTALMLAATHGKLDAVIYLVEVAKVDVNYKSQNGIARGKTALVLAREAGQKTEADRKTEADQKAEADRKAVINYLLQHGAE